MIRLRTIAHKIYCAPRGTLRWFVALPPWQKASTTAMILIAVLAVVTSTMWIKLNNEARDRCAAIHVVSDLFLDVGGRTGAPPASPDLLREYAALKQYSAGHRDDVTAALLLRVLSSTFERGSRSETPTVRLLNAAGQELERACR